MLRNTQSEFFAKYDLEKGLYAAFLYYVEKNELDNIKELFAKIKPKQKAGLIASYGEITRANASFAFEEKQETSRRINFAADCLKLEMARYFREQKQIINESKEQNKKALGYGGLYGLFKRQLPAEAAFAISQYINKPSIVVAVSKNVYRFAKEEEAKLNSNHKHHLENADENKQNKKPRKF